MGFNDLSLLVAAGPILLVLAVLSVFSVALIVVKTVQLRGVTSGTQRRNAAIEAWHSGRGDPQAELLSGPAPADRVTLRAMERLGSGLSRGDVEAEMTRMGNEEVQVMSRHIRALEVIAIVSPLLGLLGTVLGMIGSFQQLQLAGGSANASVLAGGIWQALLTTAAGLIVAIPATLAASLLSERIDRAAHLIEDGVARLLETQSA